MDPLDPALFAASSPCRPCCPAPENCQCALLIPLNSFGNLTPNGTYPDYATAVDVIARQVFDCILFLPNLLSPAIAADTSVPDQITVTVVTAATPTAWDLEAMFALNLFGGESLTVDFNVTIPLAPNTGIDVFLYDCAGNPVLSASVFFDTPGPWSGTLNVGTVPADGYYRIIVLGGRVTENSSVTLVIKSTGIFANPVIAQWDDAGTTRQLEACPKMYLPPLAEIVGIWYVDLAAAEDAVSGSWVQVGTDPLEHYITESCIVFYIYDSSNPDTTITRNISASGGSALNVSFTRETAEPGDNPNTLFASVNLLGGSVLSVAYDFTLSWNGPFSGSYSVVVELSGPIGPTQSRSVFEFSPTSPKNTVGTFIFDPVAASGRYNIAIRISASPGNGLGLTSTATGTFTVTSSDTMSVNPAQALYDVGLDCPARLDCV